MVDKAVTVDLIRYLRRLGLTAEEARIYVALVEQGEATPLELSRLTQINRTKVYRTIEVMTAKKMVFVEIGEHTTKVSPAPASQLGEMVKQKQRGVAELSQQFPEVERVLTSLGVQRQADTKVRFYRGKSGIEQMVWNVLKAESEIVGYTYRDLEDFVGKEFMGKFVSEFVRRNLRMRDIYGDGYVKSEKKGQDWQGHIDSRYLSDKILTIPHQMDIYDEVVTFYHWHGGEVFGVEIYNRQVANHQRQLFQLAWEKAAN